MRGDTVYIIIRDIYILYIIYIYILYKYIYIYMSTYIYMYIYILVCFFVPMVPKYGQKSCQVHFHRSGFENRLQPVSLHLVVIPEILFQVDTMRNLLDDQMEEMHGLFVAHFQKNKRMPETQVLSARVEPDWVTLREFSRILVASQR